MSIYTGLSLPLPSELFEAELEPNELLTREMPKHTVLFTTTMYQTNNGLWKPDILMRAQLAKRMFQKSRAWGYDIVCVDSDSEGGWLQCIKDLGVIVEPEKPDQYRGNHPLGKSRRQSGDIAANLGTHETLTWLEPEKHPYIATDDYHYWSPAAMVAAPVYERKVDAAIPRRIDLSHYPITQQLNETYCNLTAMHMMRDALRKRGVENPEEQVHYLDHCSGPRTIHRDYFDYFLRYPGEINGKPHDQWESIIVPLWEMMLKGKRVGGVAVPYVHPAEQTALESKNAVYDMKRAIQANTLISALGEILGLTAAR